jgi:hypothetical protein
MKKFNKKIIIFYVFTLGLFTTGHSQQESQETINAHGEKQDQTPVSILTQDPKPEQNLITTQEKITQVYNTFKKNFDTTITQLKETVATDVLIEQQILLTELHKLQTKIHEDLNNTDVLTRSDKNEIITALHTREKELEAQILVAQDIIETINPDLAPPTSRALKISLIVGGCTLSAGITILLLLASYNRRTSSWQAPSKATLYENLHVIFS